MTEVRTTRLLCGQYRRGARGPFSFDCIGVAADVLHQLHGDAALGAFPSTDPSDPETLRDLDADLWEEVDENTREPGVVVLTEAPDPETGTMRHHAWTFVDRARCITATPACGVKIVARTAIRQPIVGCYRLRGAR